MLEIDLRSHKYMSATKIMKAFILVKVSRESEVCNFYGGEIAVNFQENISWLQVPVYYTQLMYVIESKQ